MARPRWSERVPRFARWKELHDGLDACRDGMRAITNDQVLEFFELPLEMKFVEPIRNAGRRHSQPAVWL